MDRIRLIEISANGSERELAVIRAWQSDPIAEMLLDHKDVNSVEVIMEDGTKHRYERVED
jgi:hypothetical protein